jgi:hypothetical protein
MLEVPREWRIMELIAEAPCDEQRHTDKEKKRDGIRK